VPGESERDNAVPGYLDQTLATLRFGSAVPNWCFDRRLSATGGAKYWRAKLRPLTDVVGWDAVAEGVAWLEFLPYHSLTYKSVPELVPSQRFTFGRLRQAMTRLVPVVALRGLTQWTTAVPELAAYQHLVTARNPRASSVSPGNLGEDGFARVVRALAGS